MRALRSEVFPEPREPVTSIVACESMKKDSRPAASGDMYFTSTNCASVHGVVLCSLNANAIPSGERGGAMAATLVSKSGKS